MNTATDVFVRAGALTEQAEAELSPLGGMIATVWEAQASEVALRAGEARAALWVRSWESIGTGRNTRPPVSPH